MREYAFLVFHSKGSFIRKRKEATMIEDLKRMHTHTQRYKNCRQATGINTVYTYFHFHAGVDNKPEKYVIRICVLIVNQREAATSK